MNRLIARAVNRRSLLTAFLLNLAVAALAFLVPIAMGGGLFVLAGDFNSQQIPFTMHGIDMIRSGQIGFDYALDLGSDFMGSMAFYILGTPFFWLASLFPPEAFMYLVGWFYVLKYALAGMTGYAWISRYVSPRNAAAASMLYAFSGFMNENLLFYHFHDVVLLFPLLLITMDDLVEKKRRGPFILAVAVNALVNYYFLIGNVVFLILYYFIKYYIPDRKRYGKMFFSVLFEGVLGCALTCILLLPAFLFVIQNPRVKMDYNGANSLVFSGQRYLFILKSLLYIGEVMSDHTAVYDRNFSSCAAYLPLLGITLVLAYCLRYRKSWIKRMLCTCLVFACIPILNALLSAFAGLYCRWFYIPILFMALSSGVMLDDLFAGDPEAGRRTDEALIITACLAAFFVLFIAFVPWSESTPTLMYRSVLFWVYAGVCFLGIITTWLLLRWRKRPPFEIFFAVLCLFSLLTTTGLVVSYQMEHQHPAGDHYEEIRLSENLELPDGYRLNTDNNMLSLAHGFPATGNFCSTVSGSIFRFYEALGLRRDVKSPDAPTGLAELVSARYGVEETRLSNIDENEADPEGVIRVLTGKYWQMKETEDPNIPRIGFTYDSYMTMSEFLKTDEDLRTAYMLRALVIPDEEETAVRRRLSHYQPAENDRPAKEEITGLAYEHLSEQSEIFEKDAGGFRSVIRTDREKYAFFSIPNDSGWTASVNGQETGIIDICGFMAVPVEEGENEIVFTYVTPGLAEGKMITLAAALISVLYVLASCIYSFGKKHSRKNRKMK